MIYDFDHGPDRRGTNCLKYDFAPERGKPADVLPLWVADMDFPAPAPVLEKIHAMADHGIFGYTDTKPAYDAAVCGCSGKAKSQWISSDTTYTSCLAQISPSRASSALVQTRPTGLWGLHRSSRRAWVAVMTSSS